MSDTFDPLPGARQLVFRLEALPAYSVEEEDSAYRRFLSGLPPDPNANAEWAQLIHQIRANGAQIERLRLVSEPLTDYERFELLAGYLPGVAAGEVIRIATRPAVVDQADFFLVDDEWIERISYDENGEYLGSRIERVDPNELTALRRWIQAYANATPLEEFVAGL